MDEDNKAEGTKPYKIVTDHDDCDEFGVIKIADGKLMGCHDTQDEAAGQVAALYAADEEDKGGNSRKKPKKSLKGSSKKELVDEIVKGLESLLEEDTSEEDEKELSLDQELSAIRDAFYEKFKSTGTIGSDWIREVFKEYIVIQSSEKLYKATYSKDNDGNIQFPEKSKWQQVEISYLPTGQVGVKSESPLVIYEDTKEMSLEGVARTVRDAFSEQYDPRPKQEVEQYKPRPWIREIYPDYVICGWNNKMYKVGYSTDENGKIKFADKSKWVEMEYHLMPTGNIGAKGIWEGFEEAVKERSFTDWVEEYYQFSDKSAIELSEGEAIKAVWSTAFVNNLPNSSFLYIKPDCGENDEDGMMKPRSCRMFPYKTADGNIDLPHLRNAIARAPQANLPEEVRAKIQKRAQSLLAEENKDEGEKAGRKIRGSMMDRVKKAWEALKEIMDWAAEPEENEVKTFLKGIGETGIGIKKVGDKWWYVTYSTNAFQDREKEIFSTKSLEKYVTEAEKKEDRGFFNLWHINTKENPTLTDFAKKEWQGVAGRFLIEAGPFLDDKKGQSALKFFQEFSEGHSELAPEGWGCSPEYKYLPEERKKGVYENVWITRTSTLPKMAAANIWTNGGITMALTAEQKKSLETIFGGDAAKEIIGVAETKTKELEEAGVGHKSVEEEVTQESVKELPDEEVIVQKVAEKMTTNFEPIAALLQEIADKQKAFESELVNLKTEVQGAKSIETKELKDNAPKYVFSLVQRASEAEKTVVPDEDPLKDKKPVEAQKSDKSGAAAFFGGK